MTTSQSTTNGQKLKPRQTIIYSRIWIRSMDSISSCCIAARMSTLQAYPYFVDGDLDSDFDQLPSLVVHWQNISIAFQANFRHFLSGFILITPIGRDDSVVRHPGRQMIDPTRGRGTTVTWDSPDFSVLPASMSTNPESLNADQSLLPSNQFHPPRSRHSLHQSPILIQELLDRSDSLRSTAPHPKPHHRVLWAFAPATKTLYVLDFIDDTQPATLQPHRDLVASCMTEPLRIGMWIPQRQG